MNHYLILADLFRYPDGSQKAKVDLLNEILTDLKQNSIDDISILKEYFSCTSLEQQQENYIRTFDVNAQCFLDIGYILFGEDYKRGEFLVRLSNEHKTVNNDCGSELSDFLPNLLNLLYKSNDTKFVEELSYCLMIPAVKEMIADFKNDVNIYKAALKVLLVVLSKDFIGTGLEQFNIIKKSKDCFSRKGGRNGHSCGANESSKNNLISNSY